MSSLLREIGSNVAKLRALLTDAKKDLQRIQTLQSALQETLKDVWTSTELDQLSKSSQAWKEFVNLVASGRVLSVSAQAADALRAGSADFEREGWLGSGKKYAKWLGAGVATLSSGCSTGASSGREWKPVAELCGRSLSLGYTDDIVSSVIEKLLLEGVQEVAKLQSLVRSLAAHEQRGFLLSTISLVSSRYLKNPTSKQTLNNHEDRKIVSVAAALLQTVVATDEETMVEYLSEWLLKAPSVPTTLYRAVTTTMPAEEREKILEQIWSKFADQIFVKHTPILQQEAITKILLLLAGNVHRRTPMAVYMLAHSSIHTNGVSTRLSSASARARFLGMAVGSAISQLVDKPETRMKFEFEDSDKDGYQELRGLLEVDDSIGSLEDLGQSQVSRDNATIVLARRPAPSKPAKPKPQKTISKIQVIDSSSSADDSDLPAYAKPDSDASDSDDDPSIARRQKPKAPVYIRDLITGLTNTDDYDIQHLSLITAPSLIRRKADFGTELADRTLELCSVYFNLSDPFGLDDFLDLRLQGMTALLVAQPRLSAPFFASTVFTGDYNIGQRIAGLTAMGLSGRELAGFQDPHTPPQPTNPFPSSTLPDHLHNLYLTHTHTQPTNATHPKRKGRKRIRNDLSALVTNSFFFPLTAHFATHASTLPASSRILPTFLHTLAILLTAAGPATLALPQLTSEFFALLLSLRARAWADGPLLEALLFALLSLLNVNEDKRSLAEGYAKEVVEVHEWCVLVFERVSAGGTLRVLDEETERVKGLCAGVLAATGEVREGYERVVFARMGGLGLG